MPKAVVIATSASELQGQPTGYWYEEVAAPYYVLKEGGYEVDLASIQGGEPTCDAKSLAEGFLTEYTKRFDADEEAKNKMKNTLALKTLDPSAYSIVFFAGGYGACVDFPNQDEVTSFISKAYAHKRVVASVCHGPNCLVGATNEAGESIVKGKTITGFTNEEEAQIKAGGGAQPHFYLEDKLKELGGTFMKADPWADYSVADGRLVTGQNPASSASTARKAVEAAASS